MYYSYNKHIELQPQCMERYKIYGFNVLLLQQTQRITTTVYGTLQNLINIYHPNICTLWHILCDICQLLHVSATELSSSESHYKNKAC